MHVCFTRLNSLHFHRSDPFSTLSTGPGTVGDEAHDLLGLSQAQRHEDDMWMDQIFYVICEDLQESRRFGQGLDQLYEDYWGHQLPIEEFERSLIKRKVQGSQSSSQARD